MANEITSLLISVDDFVCYRADNNRDMQFITMYFITTNLREYIVSFDLDVNGDS